MILNSLALTNFKNIAEASLEFSPNINCLVGNNGMGKSNLLDAIFFLSYCRSFSGLTDAQVMRRGSDFMTLRGNYLRRDAAEEVYTGLRQGSRKVFRRNGKPYQRLSEHLGQFPAVLLSPADMELSAGEPSERRRFIDRIISQRDAAYYDALQRYNSALEQRNRLLRDGVADATLYEALEMQLDMHAAYISRCRRAEISTLETIFTPLYNAIAGTDEHAALEYITADYISGGRLEHHLADTRSRDMLLHHTASGIHRDDISFTIDGLPVRRSASQGQAKTFTTALRFAQYELLRRALAIRPLLLLDDIFDKLDADRVERIIALVGDSDTFGQIFVTDTNRRHLDETVAAIGRPYGLWSVENGSFTPLQP